MRFLRRARKDDVDVASFFENLSRLDPNEVDLREIGEAEPSLDLRERRRDAAASSDGHQQDGRYRPTEPARHAARR